MKSNLKTYMAQSVANLQRTLKEAMEGGAYEYSEDEPGQPDRTKFKLPKRLRGWLFMERARVPLKEHSGILNMTQ